MGFALFLRAKNTRKPSRIKGLRVFITESEITFTDGLTSCGDYFAPPQYLVVKLRSHQPRQAFTDGGLGFRRVGEG